MAKEFKLPDLGEGLKEATLVDWKVKEGDEVAAEQVLAEVETDKAMSELPSPFAGKIAKLHFKAGDVVPVGAAVVTFDALGDREPSLKTPQTSSDVARAEEAKKSSPAAARRMEKVETPAPVPADKQAERRAVLAAPATRKLAREHGLDIQSIRGTGPGGRVTPEDVLSYASSPARRRGEPPGETAEPAPVAEGPIPFPRPMLPDFSKWGEVERQRATAIRKRIAQRMIIASQTAAAVTHMDEADVTSLEENRLKAKQRAEEKGVKLTLLPYVIKAVVAALVKRPIFNASYDDDKQEIVLKKYYHIGVAADSPLGLLVPVVRDADKKTVTELAKDIRELAEKARDGKLAAEQMRGGSFTITNVGAIGGLAFTPIINWPEAAILGLGRMHDQPALVGGQLVNRKIMPLMLTFDHRLIDGAEAARFVNDVKQYLENPLLLLLEM